MHLRRCYCQLLPQDMGFSRRISGLIGIQVICESHQYCVSQLRIYGMPIRGRSTYPRPYMIGMLLVALPPPAQVLPFKTPPCSNWRNAAPTTYSLNMYHARSKCCTTPG